jgi:uncharacterized membrane protein YbhN (UPF0104 family)
MPVGVALTILFFWLFRALRWFVLLEASGIHIAFSRLYLVGAISVALAILTPLQSGEALKVEFLKKSGLVERVPGYGIFLTERILDFIVVVLMAVLSMVFGVSRFLDIQTVLAAVAILLICFFVFVLMVRRLSPASSWGRFFQPFRQCIRSGRLLAIAVTLTVVGWLFIVLGWYASLRSIAVSVSLVETTAMMTVTTLIGLLSLIPWSLGISEVSIVSFLFYFKQEIPLAQTGALMIRLYGMVTLVLGLIHFVVWKWIDLIRKNR